MKTTYPKRWKGRSKNDGRIIDGPTLTTDGDGNYGISQLSRVETAIAHMSGYDIKAKTIEWLCSVGRKWNSRYKIKCQHCDAVLHKFKDVTDGN
jgi:hypothetical protein